MMGVVVPINDHGFLSYSRIFPYFFESFLADVLACNVAVAVSGTVAASPRCQAQVRGHEAWWPWLLWGIPHFQTTTIFMQDSS